jgi:4-hydroxy-tetrahydrodipicolinate reductase
MRYFMSLAVMVNGIPGKMGIAVAQAVLSRGYTLVPYSLTGEQVQEEESLVNDVLIRLIKPSERAGIIRQIKEEFPGMITVDFTHPTAVNSNAQFYAVQQLPFVMGTTGGDREQLMQTVQEANLPCVIAPNMAKQIVAFQAMMEYMAQNFPGVFAGWSLDVEESHQKAKADTSGTAKAVVTSLQTMGLDYNVEDIRKIRDEQEQMEWMGVPEGDLGWHAFHTYNIDSPDDSVHFEFVHNVCGGSIYAEGTVDAVAFLAEQLQQGARKQYTMIDVLRSGSMK